MKDILGNGNSNGTPEKFPLSSLTFTSNSGSFSGQGPAKSDTFNKNRTESEAQEDGGYFYKNGKLQKAKGLGWVVTGLFVVGDLAGGGLVALPTAMIQFGFFFGMFFTVLMSIIVSYTAYVLGQCWCILQRRWPEAYTQGHVRKPYPEIAYRAMGPSMK
uniref:Amino acid transporter transmembrane domain-containing protein n=1 Tax=Ditylenchus dipsaci TaxID=166011 RepID=A0A915CPH7_9BILA